MAIDLAHIVSPSHSGSTLLTLLLAAHRDVTTIGEMKANLRGDVRSYLCSCGIPVTTCKYWRRVGQRMLSRGFDFDITQGALHFRLPQNRIVDRLARLDHGGVIFEYMRDLALSSMPAWRRHYRRTRRETAALIEVVTELNGARVFVDSSKHPARLKYLKALESVNLKGIHLIRDGRGVTHTYISQRNYPMELAAHEWKRAHLSAERALSRLDRSRCIRVHYEGLCQSPERVLGDVFDFLGVAPSAVDYNRQPREHHVVGNSMRLQFTGAIELDDRWQRELTSEQLSTFDRVCGRLNRKYGYQ